MSLQALAGKDWDHRLYNINRDVAHNFRPVVEEVARRLEDRHWPFLHTVLTTHGVTEEELGKACEGFMLFVASAVEHPKESMGQCLRRSGYLDTSEAAQVAYMAILGTVMSGYYWVGAREATIGGVGPCLNPEQLQAAGREANKLIAMPRWRRIWFRLVHRVERVRDAIMGRESSIKPTPLQDKNACTLLNNQTVLPSAPSSTRASATSRSSPAEPLPSSPTSPESDLLPNTDGLTSLPPQIPDKPTNTGE